MCQFTGRKLLLFSGHGAKSDMKSKSKITKQEKIPKNCPKCNGPLELKKTLGRMRFGQCPKCKHTYALI